MSTAASIKVSEALRLLDGPFEGLAAGVSRGEYAFWLGSGISLGRAYDISEVVTRILDFLGSKAVAEGAGGAHSIALQEAFDLAGLSAADRAAIKIEEPVSTWPSRATLINSLPKQYSRLLDIRVTGHPDAGYLLREAVNAPEAFAELNDPDCEHLCLAILALEGVLPDLVTANWDGLVEVAIGQISDNSDAILKICVIADDFANPPLPTRMMKFHGCSVRAAADPGTYFRLLIARYSQITGWQTDPEFALMRGEMVTLAATKHTLMLGLSAQDVNIQFVFGEAKNLRKWPWPCNPPAHVFAEDRLGPDQRNILRVVYQDSYDNNVAEIEASALFRAYAKPALIALVLHVLCIKLSTLLLHVDAPHFSADERLAATNGLTTLRDIASRHAEPNRLEFVRALIRQLGETSTLFQTGTHRSDGRYHPIGDVATHRIGADATLSTSGVRELAAALSVLGRGKSQGHWDIAVSNASDPTLGALRIVVGTESTRIFFAANDYAGVQLEINGIVAPDARDAIIVHSISPVPKMARSPFGAPGRINRTELRHVAMAQLLRETTSASNLTERFRQEALV